MTCPVCSRAIPDDLLDCPLCLAGRSYRAVRAFQHAALREVLAGRARLIVRSVKQKRHLQMFGAMQSFCGVEFSPQHRESRIGWDPSELNRVCTRCRALVQEIAGEARCAG